MERVPVVDYRRLKRLAPTTEEVNISNRVCIGILLIAVVILYKRYRDKSHRQPQNVDTLWL
jgi:hypothetical protein